MTAEPIPSGVDPVLQAHWRQVFQERADLFERIDGGDMDAFVELIELALPGAKAGPVTSHRRDA